MTTFHGKPVVFCFIAWMRDYAGLKADDIPIWDHFRRPNGIVRRKGKPSYYLGEVTKFLPWRDRAGDRVALGFVQGNFDTRRKLDGEAELATDVLVVWCAADPEDRNVVKVVGWYRNATVYRIPRTDLRSHVPASPHGVIHRDAAYTIASRFSDATLVPRSIRPALPVRLGNSEDGRWHSRSKHWYGDDAPQWTPFLNRWLNADLQALSKRETQRHRPPIKRRQVLVTIRERQGQFEFRERLLQAYAEKCAVTGCNVRALLDACHLNAACNVDSHHGVDNGVLLRTDLHTLFDLGLLAFVPATRTVWIAPSIREKGYRALHGLPLREPVSPWPNPASKQLSARWKLRSL